MPRTPQAPKVFINRATVARILKRQQVVKMTENAAKSVAANAGPNARVRRYTTDRKAAAVSVPAEEQARDGKLTRGASASGLRVRGGR